MTAADPKSKDAKAVAHTSMHEWDDTVDDIHHSFSVLRKIATDPTMAAESTAISHRHPMLIDGTEAVSFEPLNDDKNSLNDASSGVGDELLDQPEFSSTSRNKPNENREACKIEEENKIVGLESRSVHVLKVVVLLMGALVVTGTFLFLRQSESQAFDDAVRFAGKIGSPSFSSHSYFNHSLIVRSSHFDGQQDGPLSLGKSTARFA
jgi:hypothetical protein